MAGLPQAACPGSSRRRTSARPVKLECLTSTPARSPRTAGAHAQAKAVDADLPHEMAKRDGRQEQRHLGREVVVVHPLHLRHHGDVKTRGGPAGLRRKSQQMQTFPGRLRRVEALTCTGPADTSTEVRANQGRSALRPLYGPARETLDKFQHRGITSPIDRDGSSGERAVVESGSPCSTCPQRSGRGPK